VADSQHRPKGKPARRARLTFPQAPPLLKLRVAVAAKAMEAVARREATRLLASRQGFTSALHPGLSLHHP